MGGLAPGLRRSDPRLSPEAGRLGPPAEGEQRHGEGAPRFEHVGMLVAEEAHEVRQCVEQDAAGLLGLADLVQHLGHAGGCLVCEWVLLAEQPAQRGPGLLASRRASAGSPARYARSASSTADHTVSGWSGPSTRRRSS